jgi:hypothetical protein
MSKLTQAPPTEIGNMLSSIINGGVYPLMYPVIHYPYESLRLTGEMRERYEYHHGDFLDNLHTILIKAANVSPDNKQGFNFMISGKPVFLLFYDWTLYISDDGRLRR